MKSAKELDINFFMTARQMTDEHLQSEQSDFAVTLTQLAECFNTSFVMLY